MFDKPEYCCECGEPFSGTGVLVVRPYDQTLAAICLKCLATMLSCIKEKK